MPGRTKGWLDSHKGLDVYLTVAEVQALAKVFPEWEEIRDNVNLALKFIRERPEERCRFCFKHWPEHSLGHAVRCAPRNKQADECEHDWRDDFMGGSTCGKCHIAV